MSPITRREWKRSLRVVRGDEGSPYPKCSFVLRALARVVDVIIAVGLVELLGNSGMVAALLYLALADGVGNGQSVGKRIFGVRVMYIPTRIFGRYRESVLRNAPFGLIVLLGMLPPPLGHVGFIGGTLVIGGIELWRVVRDPLGVRLGDAWAETQVVDAKVVAGGQALAAETPAARTPGRALSGVGNRIQLRARRRFECGSR